MEDGDAGWVEAVMVSGAFPVRVMGVHVDLSFSL
jgi:hypothetical protein